MFYSIIYSTFTSTHAQYVVRVGFNARNRYRTKLVFISNFKGYEWMAFPFIKGEVDFGVELAQVRVKSSLSQLISMVHEELCS